MKEVTVKELSRHLVHTPLMLHINPIGLIRLGSSNIERYSSLNILLNNIQENSGNVAIPTYSYTYTKKETYNVKNTPSDLGEVSEFLRLNNKLKRTADANFSYLLFGNKFSDKYFSAFDYSTFSEGSLIDEVFKKGGYLGAIGGALEYLTEIHYLERKLNINYRFDKIFKGSSVDSNDNVVNNQMTYFCRDLDSDYLTSFIRLKQDIRSEGLVETWKLKEFNLKIEVVKIQELYPFIEEKLLIDPRYLWDKTCLTSI